MSAVIVIGIYMREINATGHWHLPLVLLGPAAGAGGVGGAVWYCARFLCFFVPLYSNLSCWYYNIICHRVARNTGRTQKPCYVTEAGEDPTNPYRCKTCYCVRVYTGAR
jgi:hypothetical protein